MSLTYDDLAAWKAGASSLWYATLVLSDGEGNSRTLYCSVEPREIGVAGFSAQYDGSIAEMDSLAHGYAELAPSRYTMSDLRLRLLSVHTGDQDHGETILDVLTAFPIIGGTLTLYHAWKTSNLTSSLLSRQVFVGRVYLVDDISATGVTIRARSEVYADIRATGILRAAAYPSALKDDEGSTIPFIAGRTGFVEALFTADRGSVTGGSRTIGYTVGGQNMRTRAYLVDVDPASPYADALGFLVNKGTVKSDSSSAAEMIAKHSSFRNMVMSVPVTQDETAGAGTVYWEPDTNGDYLATVYYVPQPNESQIDITSFKPSTWADAFDLSLDTYAEVNNALDASLITEDCPIVFPPLGASYSDHSQTLATVFALVYVETGSGDTQTTRIGVKYNTSGDDYTDDATVQNGYNFITHTIGNPEVNSTTRDSGWCRSGLVEGIYVGRYLSTSPGTALMRVLLFGVYTSIAMDKRVMSRPIRSAEDITVGTPGNAGEVPTYYYQGTGITDVSTNAHHVLRDSIIELAGRGGLTLTGANFDQTGGNLSFDGFVTDQACKLAIVEDRDSTLTSIIDRVCESLFCQVWLSPKDGKWHMRAKETDPDSDGVVLYDHNLLAPLSVELDADRVFNAIRYNYGYAAADGRYMNEVFIDGTDGGSRMADGTQDTTREAEADVSQDRYGRRDLVVNTKYVNDPDTAENVLLRMFDVLSVARLGLRATVDMDFAHQLEPGYVFTTDASLDDHMRCPLFAYASPGGTERDQSWSGLKWWVTRVTETPGQPFVVEAVNVD